MAVVAQLLLGVGLGHLVNEDAVLADPAVLLDALALCFLVGLLLAPALLLALLLLALLAAPLAARDVRCAFRDSRDPRRAAHDGGGVLGAAVVDVLVDAAAAQLGRGCGTREDGAVGASTPQHRGLVVVPVVLPEVNAAVLGPEEEPNARDDDGGTDETKHHEHGGVVDVRGRDHTPARVDGIRLGAITGEEHRSRCERTQRLDVGIWRASSDERRTEGFEESGRHLESRFREAPNQ